MLDKASVVSNNAGEHLIIELPIDRFWRNATQLVAARLDHLHSLPRKSIEQAIRPLIAALPDRVALLDLETCGLAGSPLFLIGLIRAIDSRLTVELLFARTYAEEKAVLVSLWERLARVDALATFNGKSFDWPTVLDRSRRHLLHKERPLTGPEHFDLLHPARRRWRAQLPDCKLQTLERCVCRRSRTGDIPGSQIPAAYEAFVRTGAAGEIEAVLHHNALDLITLLDLTLRLSTPASGAVSKKVAKKSLS
ncbi:MAG: ribonuclease H-like domain-containing protein [Planctomycetota bacterium]